MKNTLFILTEDLNNGVIQSQVFGHIDFMKKKKVSNPKSVPNFFTSKYIFCLF